MSDSVTIARPYAKATFEYALAKQRLAAWSEYLSKLSGIVSEASAQSFITNPATNATQHNELLASLLGKISKEDEEQVKNLIATLAHNKRLSVLPDIALLFNEMRNEQEKTIVVTVSSYSELSKDQQQSLSQALSKRLQREVTLNILIDEELIGGAVIHAGDLVIDGSVRGKLNKLRTDLAA